MKQTVIQNRLARPQKNQWCCVIIHRIHGDVLCCRFSYYLYLGILHTFLFLHREGTTSRRGKTKHDEMIGWVEVGMEHGGEGKSILYYELSVPDARTGTGCCLYIIRSRSVTEDFPSVNGKDFPNPIMCANLIRRCCFADCYSETLFHSRYMRVSKWWKFSVKLFLTEITCW